MCLWIQELRFVLRFTETILFDKDNAVSSFVVAILLLSFVTAFAAERDRERARIAAVTRPTSDFSRSERYESRPGGATTVFKTLNRDIFSHPSPTLPTCRSTASSTSGWATASSRRCGCRRPAPHHLVGRPRPAVQRPRLPALPPEGRPRPSAGPGRAGGIDVSPALDPGANSGSRSGPWGKPAGRCCRTHLR